MQPSHQHQITQVNAASGSIEPPRQRLGLFIVGCLNYFWRHLDGIVLLLMMSAICNFGLSVSDQPIARDSINALDESWEIDLVHKANMGVWAGRDFLFTYGPLWQYLASILPRAAGASTGSIFKLLYLFSYWASFILAFLAARLLLGHCEGWQRAVFIISLIVFWLPIDVRIGFALFCFAAYLRLVHSLSGETALFWRCAFSSILITASFLLASDAGALSAGAFAIILACSLVLTPQGRVRNRLIYFAVGTAVSTFVCMLIVNTWVGSPLNFQFWEWALQVTSVYRWLMASAMTPEVAIRLGVTLGVCAVLFAGAWFTRDPTSEALTMRPLFIVAGALFSCLAMQKGVVRSGWGHVSGSLLPAVAFSGMILVGYRKATRPRRSQISLLTAVALTVCFSGPASLFAWSGVMSRVFWVAPAYPYCPPGTYYLDQTCLLRRDYATFGTSSGYISGHSRPADPILVYPYQNLFGMLSARRVSAGVLQNYVIGGGFLSSLQISTWERERPPLAVYCADGIVSWPVDGVSSFQRAAPVWFYLQRHYATEAVPAAGVLILRRDDARAAKIESVVRELWRPSGSVGADSVIIDPSHWRAFQIDFLRVKVRVAYSLPWKISKPSAVGATMGFSDGTSSSIKMAIEPDKIVEAWIYPWPEIDLRRYFLADGSQWRQGGRELPAVTSLQIHAQPYDFLSVRPKSLEILAIDGVSLQLGSQRLGFSKSR